MKKFISIITCIVMIFSFTSISFAETNLSNAENINIGDIITGEITETDSENVYQFTLEDSGELNIDYSAAIWSSITIYDKNEKQIWDMTIIGDIEPKWKSTSFNIHMESGIYYFTVSEFNDFKGLYEFKLSTSVSNIPGSDIFDNDDTDDWNDNSNSTNNLPNDFKGDSDNQNQQSDNFDNDLDNKDNQSDNSNNNSDNKNNQNDNSGVEPDNNDDLDNNLNNDSDNNDNWDTNNDFSDDLNNNDNEPNISSIFIIGQPFYSINNEIKHMDAAPVIRKNRTMLPFRYIAGACGLNENSSVSWNGNTETAAISGYGKVVMVTKGNKVMTIIENGLPRYVVMDTAPVIEKNRTYVPFRAVAEEFGFDVEWHSDSRTVVIYKDNNFNY